VRFTDGNKTTMKCGERMKINLEVKSRKKTALEKIKEFIKKKNVKFPIYGKIRKQNFVRKGLALKESCF
jgi:hypothetical protein